MLPQTQPYLFTLALLTIPASSRANFDLDALNDAPVSLQASNPTTSGLRQASSALFGTRLIALQQGVTHSTSPASAVISNGLTINSGAPGESHTMLAYGSTSYSGGFNFGSQDSRNYDLSSTSRINFYMTGMTAGSRFQLFFNDDISYSLYAYNVPATNVSPFVVSINLNTPSGTSGPFNRSHTDNIKIDFYAPAGGQIGLSRIEAVPEPTTMLALAGGLVALIRRRRTQKGSTHNGVSWDMLKRH